MICYMDVSPDLLVCLRDRQLEATLPVREEPSRIIGFLVGLQSLQVGGAVAGVDVLIRRCVVHEERIVAAGC